MTLESTETIEDVVPNFRLDGRIAVVTGGAGGLSITLTRALLAQGAHVALVDLNQQVCDAAAEDLALWGQKQGLNPLPKISSWSCNIGNADEVELTVNKINEHYNDISDLLIHTAGYCQNYTALEYPNQKAADLVQVNLMGSYYVAKAIAKNLVDAQRPGSIVMIGSMSGVIVNDPQPQFAYNAAKAGVIHLTKSLACEWAKYGIRVNCVSPGYILTPLTKHVIGSNVELKNTWESKIPMARMANPQEFVGAILYFGSHNASSYTTGENLIVDGGYSCW
ncbi:D-arabinitol 2-dehydrogenase [Wickerhamomyces ciferrii]|uniref:D-arabinitol 2-dehydrogenase [ribulose-forming] n=1 Tax=Wickerhamomyces ciferrii (strain ATCC 14091 / BCRC 22168 / CBS 111 / JCM 3599 / NBRC 0793 / NRRL Y-1031 F-60-10) TaxID=1206466 RepID=K0KFI8_WICCF|nr:D-arabinitol 2-dehydrogenase [Wickerhamomyces ciferrii]CCH43895.1 D-arabinitol 2-dehydrogenase [Wickerhamomyces ciferrii]